MEAKKHNILYVDDEPENLTAFTATFRRYYNIYTATSAAEGIDIMRTVEIHVVITDQRMPEMTGVQFFEAIIPEYPDTIRMILTGFTDVEAIIKAINSGRVFRYITKPWDPNELKINIDSGLKLYELELERKHLIKELQEGLVKQQHILELFQKYVPKKIVDDVLNIPSNEPLIIGEYRIISAMFADIRNFTVMTTRLGPEKTVEFLNDYYTLMSSWIDKHYGNINRLLADGILVLFGAPVSYISNQVNSVLCGLDMLEALKELNKKYHDVLESDVSIGIGIHTGEVIVGNVGTPDHIEYTAIGDTVNTAERIQELTREMPNNLLISESTYKMVKTRVEVEELGPQKLRGKDEQLLIYKVVGKKM